MVITAPQILAVAQNTVQQILAAGVGQPGASDAQNAGTPSLYVGNYPLQFNGTSYDRVRVPITQTATAGASALTILGAGGVGVKNRIFGILIGSNNAGVVVINDISGGISTNVAAGASNFIPFPPSGVVQGTANTAITATLAAATLSAVVLSGPS